MTEVCGDEPVLLGRVDRAVAGPARGRRVSRPCARGRPRARRPARPGPPTARSSRRARRSGARAPARARAASSKGGAAFVGAVRTSARSQHSSTPPARWRAPCAGTWTKRSLGAQQDQQQPVRPPGGDVEQDVGHVAEAGPLAVVGAGAEERGQQAGGLHRPSGFGARRALLPDPRSAAPRLRLRSGAWLPWTVGAPQPPHTPARRPGVPDAAGDHGAHGLLLAGRARARRGGAAGLHGAQPAAADAVAQRRRAPGQPAAVRADRARPGAASPRPAAAAAWPLAILAPAGRSPARRPRALKQLLAHPRHADWLGRQPDLRGLVAQRPRHRVDDAGAVRSCWRCPPRLRPLAAALGDRLRDQRLLRDPRARLALAERRRRRLPRRHDVDARSRSPRSPSSTSSGPPARPGRRGAPAPLWSTARIDLALAAAAAVLGLGVAIARPRAVAEFALERPSFVIVRRRDRRRSPRCSRRRWRARRAPDRRRAGSASVAGRAPAEPPGSQSGSSAPLAARERMNSRSESRLR